MSDIGVEVEKSLSDLMAAMGVEEYPSKLAGLYPKAEEAFCTYGAGIVEEEYLRKLNGEYALFTHQFETVLVAARKIAENKALLQFIYLLKAIIEDKANTAEILDGLKLPVHGASKWEYDMVPVFALVSFAPRMTELLGQRGVPEEMIASSLRSCEACIDLFQQRYGYPGLNIVYLDWLYPYMEGWRVNIGRFNFDVVPRFHGGVMVFQNKAGEQKLLINHARIHREGRLLGVKHYEDSEGSFDAKLEETEDAWIGYAVNEDAICENNLTELKKSEWQVVLREGDSVIAVHIPRKKDFSREIRESSYAKAWDFFQRFYGEYEFKAFVCTSWMMDPQLRGMLRDTSNVLDFQSEFLLFPLLAGDGSVLSFIFGAPTEKYEDLPEDTALRRAIKQHYLDDKVIYQTGGIRFPKTDKK